MDTKEKDITRKEFYDNVNMTPGELEEWLQTEDSKNVGQKSEDGEAVGHKSGKKIIEIKRRNKKQYEEDDYEHMKKVNSYIKRHTAQKPNNNMKDSRWRYSLMNWGHDPCKNTNC